MVVHFENVSDTGGMSAYGDLTLRLALPPSMGRTPSDQGGVSATGLSFMCMYNTGEGMGVCASHAFEHSGSTLLGAGPDVQYVRAGGKGAH